MPALKAYVDVIAMNASQQAAAAAAEPVVAAGALPAAQYWNGLTSVSLFVSCHGGLRRLMKA